jgi:hypothetical protein
MWELTGEDLRLAIEIGRLASNYSNMGLTSTDIGANAYANIGNFMQKFNYWGLGKRGRDLRVIKNAIILMQPLERLGKNPWFEGKIIAKLIGKMITGGSIVADYNKMNMAQKELAQLYKFINIGVLPALILDLVVWGPLGTVVGFRALKYALQKTGGAGVIRGLPSEIAQLISIALAFGLKMGFGMIDGDDEDEEIQRFIRSFTRALPFGFGVGWNADVWLLIYSIFGTENEGLMLKRAGDVLRPVFPSHDIKMGFDYLLEKAIKD